MSGGFCCHTFPAEGPDADGKIREMFDTNQEAANRLPPEIEEHEKGPQGPFSLTALLDFPIIVIKIFIEKTYKNR